MRKTILTLSAVALGLIATGCTHNADHLQNNVNRLHRHNNVHTRVRDTRVMDRNLARERAIYNLDDSYERSMAVPYGTTPTGLYAAKDYKPVKNHAKVRTVTPITRVDTMDNLG